MHLVVLTDYYTLLGHDVKVIGSNVGQSSLATTNGYNIVDEQRKRMLSGFKTEEMIELKGPILNLLELAKESGINLAELQSEIRRIWRKKIQKNEGL